MTYRPVEVVGLEAVTLQLAGWLNLKVQPAEAVHLRGSSRKKYVGGAADLAEKAPTGFIEVKGREEE